MHEEITTRINTVVNVVAAYAPGHPLKQRVQFGTVIPPDQPVHTLLLTAALRS